MFVIPLGNYYYMCYSLCCQEGTANEKLFFKGGYPAVGSGWYLERVTGSHYHFRHPVKQGIVTVKHPDRDIPIKTLRSIERQSGLTFR